MCCSKAWYVVVRKLVDQSLPSNSHSGNTEDKKVPTLVQAFADHKMVGVDCGSGDAHTLFLEDNGEWLSIKYETMNSM